MFYLASLSCFRLKLSHPCTKDCIMCSVVTGCTNQFVEVQYSSADSTISCIFLNQMDTSIKSCNVTYGICGQNLKQTVQGSTSLMFPNTVVLKVTQSSSFYYAVTATNDSFTVVVEGSVQSKL